MSDKRKDIKDIAKHMAQPYSCTISTDGYIFITFSEEALKALHEESKATGKAIVAVHAPQLICN